MLELSKYRNLPLSLQPGLAHPLSARYALDVSVVPATPSVRMNQRIKRVLDDAAKHPPVVDAELWSRDFERRFSDAWRSVMKPSYVPQPTLLERVFGFKTLHAIKRWVGTV